MPKFSKTYLKAVDYVIEAQSRMMNSQGALINAISTKIKELQEERSLDSIFEMLRLNMEIDKEKNIEASSILSAAEDNFALSTNKLELIYQGALELFDKPSFACSLWDGKVMVYDLSLKDPVIDDPSAAYWGTSKSTYLSAALISAASKLGVLDRIDLLRSGIGQFYDVSHIEGIADSSNLFDTGYFIPHSGYSFGGSRAGNRALIYDEQRIPSSMLAQDCSSFIENIAGAEATLSTVDYLFAERRAANPSAYPEWYEASGREMSKIFEIVNLSKENPKESDIIWWRKFREEDDPHLSNGSGGHIGFISEAPSGGIFNVLSCARDMPSMEGYCRKNFDLTRADIKYGVVRVKNSHEKTSYSKLT